MLTACETYLLAHYLANVASGLRRRDPEAQALAGWMADKESHIRFGSPGRRRRARFRACHEDELSRQRFRSLRQTLQAERPTRRPRRDRTGQRLLNLAQTTGLSRTDAAILELLVRYQTHSVFQSLVDDVLIGPSRWHDVNVGGRALPLLLGHSAGAIARRLHGDAPLIRAGLVSVDQDGDMKAIDRLNRLARAPAEAGSEVNRLLFDAAPRTDLQWSDYDHVAGDRDHVETLLKGALERGEPGVNILLHGPPGTGKTEFCKAVAERLGVTLYSVSGRWPSSSTSRRALRRARRPPRGSAAAISTRYAAACAASRGFWAARRRRRARPCASIRH